MNDRIESYARANFAHATTFESCDQKQRFGQVTDFVDRVLALAQDAHVLLRKIAVGSVAGLLQRDRKCRERRPQIVGDRIDQSLNDALLLAQAMVLFREVHDQSDLLQRRDHEIREAGRGDDEAERFRRIVDRGDEDAHEAVLVGDRDRDHVIRSAAAVARRTVRQSEHLRTVRVGSGGGNGGEAHGQVATRRRARRTVREHPARLAFARRAPHHTGLFENARRFLDDGGIESPVTE